MSDTTWLVTGGAGYIGAHVARALQQSGRTAVVFDNLASGRREFVPPGMAFIQASLLDDGALAQALREHHITGVIHLAALKYAGVSVQQPLEFYEVNVTGTIRLLEAMREVGVTNLVFSSSAAIFGTPQADIVTEDTPTTPESPYGESKLIGEWLIRDYARISELNHTSLRYFNVVGSGYDDVVDTSPHNLFPLVLKAITEQTTPVVFGDDYPTPDGSCVRDYIHVADVATAHVAAAAKLETGQPVAPTYNVGLGTGTSVFDILDAMQRIIGPQLDGGAGRQIGRQIAARRPGDPARIVTSSAKANAELGWKAEHDLDEMVRSAWQAWTTYGS